MTPDDDRRADERLKALFAADRPPTPDYLFQAAVAERIARRRAVLTVAALTPWMGLAGLCLWALAPLLPQLAADLAPAASLAGVVLALVLAAAAGARWLERRRGRIWR